MTGWRRLIAKYTRMLRPIVNVASQWGYQAAAAYRVSKTMSPPMERLNNRSLTNCINLIFYPLAGHLIWLAGAYLSVAFHSLLVRVPSPGQSFDQKNNRP